ncbi:hypothetical protein H0H92_000897 [Tricholoma furcatifolium]|nr:hypothetical protein H0H92_000897 [Tricholoma furcatifolium]
MYDLADEYHAVLEAAFNTRSLLDTDNFLSMLNESGHVGASEFAPSIGRDASKAPVPVAQPVPSKRDTGARRAGSVHSDLDCATSEILTSPFPTSYHACTPATSTSTPPRVQDSRNPAVNAPPPNDDGAQHRSSDHHKSMLPPPPYAQPQRGKQLGKRSAQERQTSTKRLKGATSSTVEPRKRKTGNCPHCGQSNFGRVDRNALAPHLANNCEKCPKELKDWALLKCEERKEKKRQKRQDRQARHRSKAFDSDHAGGGQSRSTATSRSEPFIPQPQLASSQPLTMSVPSFNPFQLATPSYVIRAPGPNIQRGGVSGSSSHVHPMQYAQPNIARGTQLPFVFHSSTISVGRNMFYARPQAAFGAPANANWHHTPFPQMSLNPETTALHGGNMSFYPPPQTNNGAPVDSNRRHGLQLSFNPQLAVPQAQAGPRSMPHAFGPTQVWPEF